MTVTAKVMVMIAVHNNDAYTVESNGMITIYAPDELYALRLSYQLSNPWSDIYKGFADADKEAALRELDGKVKIVIR